MKTPLCLLALTLGLTSGASVWDDAEMVFVPWDRNGDGICNAGVQNKSIKAAGQAPEIVDLKRASLGTGSSVNSPGIYGRKDALQIVNETVTLNGTECGRSVPCFNFQCPESDGKYCPPTFRWHSSFGADMTTAFDGVEAYTIVLRFKRRAPYESEQPNYIFNFGGHNGGANKGLAIAFTKKLADGDESTRRLSLCQAGTREDLTGYIPQGEWIDVAVVSDPVNRRFRYAVRSESNGMTWGNKPYLNETYSPAPYNHDYVLGADSATATEEAASAQWMRFNGLVRHLAIWKRSLSDDEVTEVFMGGSDSPAVFPDCWQVGFDGGDAKYFAAGGTETFRVGKDPFYLMSGELPTKGSELAFSFDVGVTNANHAQVLRVRTTSDSAPGELALIIGGEEIAKAAVTADNVATLFVPGAQLSAGSKTSGTTFLRFEGTDVLLRTAAHMGGGNLVRRLRIDGTNGTLDLCPIERFDGGELTLKLSLKEGRCGCVAGRSEIGFGVQDDRYADQLVDLAAIVRGEKPNDQDYDRDLAVHGILLKACGID